MAADHELSSSDWLRTRPLVFVEDLADPRIEDADFHHLERSLRLPLGSEISVGDGQGRWQRARLAPTAELMGETVLAPEPRWPLTIAFTPVKGQKPEWVVQKLTEIGVQRIVPLVTERSVVRWDGDRSARHLARWPRVIREAAMQSRQVRLPSFDLPVAVSDFVLATPDAREADPAGAPADSAVRTLMIGPEGGWSANELEGRPSRSLPGGILRAETAAIAAGTLLTAASSR